MEWNKSLDKHPTFILLSSFVLGATLMWGILIFTLNDNREYLHKAEIENIKSTNRQQTIRNSYINPELGVVIGIHDITINDTATINLSINGSEIWNLKEVSTGAIEHFMTEGKKYELIIKKINFVYNYVNIEIIERL